MTKTFIVFSFPIYFIIIAACVGVTVGGTSLIANSIGEDNKEKVLGRN